MRILLGLVLLLGELFAGEVSAQIISGQRIGAATEIEGGGGGSPGGPGGMDVKRQDSPIVHTVLVTN